MRIGILIGKSDKGEFGLCLPDKGGAIKFVPISGLVDEGDGLQRLITDGLAEVKNGKGVVQLVKTWLADASRNPLKAKKVKGEDAPVVEPVPEAEPEGE